MEKAGSGNDLRLVVCGAGVAGAAGNFVAEAVARGWVVDVTATAMALTMIDMVDLETRSGRPVRTTYAPVSPVADALIVAPATYNTIVKLALGIADTYPLSSVAEVIGRGVPTVIVPSVNAALASRLPYRQAVASLREEGVLFATGNAEALDLIEPARSR